MKKTTKPLVDDSIFKNLYFDILQGEAKELENLTGFYKKHILELTEFELMNTQDSKIKLGKVAHKLKSSCQSFGTLALLEKLETLESGISEMEFTEIENLFKQCLALSSQTLLKLDELSKKLVSEQTKSA